jgi:hypothetical protein
MRPALTLLMFIAALAADGAGAQSQVEMFNKVFGNKAAAERALDAVGNATPAKVSPSRSRAGFAYRGPDSVERRLVDLLDDPTAACLAASQRARRVEQAVARGVALLRSGHSGSWSPMCPPSTAASSVQRARCALAPSASERSCRPGSAASTRQRTWH